MARLKFRSLFVRYIERHLLAMYTHYYKDIEYQLLVILLVIAPTNFTNTTTSYRKFLWKCSETRHECWSCFFSLHSQ